MLFRGMDIRIRSTLIPGADIWAGQPGSLELPILERLIFSHTEPGQWLDQRGADYGVRCPKVADANGVETFDIHIVDPEIAMLFKLTFGGK